MRRFIAILNVFLIICAAGGAFPAFVRADASPSPAAAGAVVMDYKSGRVLWGKNERKQLPMASTTKIMTAVVALENSKPDDIATVSRRAASQPKVRMNLHTGEKISVRSLLYALMLESSNDAAVAVAEHAGGSVEHFCDMMTEKARQIGANDTTFKTPNGLDAEGHLSTAYDMALITRYALSNEEFRAIIKTPEITFKSDRTTYTIRNRDRFLKEYDGAIGVKTGFTGAAGNCFVGAAERGDMTLISVVLGSGWGARGKQQKWKDTKEVLNYGFSNFEYNELAKKGAPAKTVPVDRSKTKSVDAYFAEDLSLPLAESERDKVRIVLVIPETLKAPVIKGQQIGLARVFIGDTCVKNIALLASADAARSDLRASLTRILNAVLGLDTNGQVQIILPEF